MFIIKTIWLHIGLLLVSVGAIMVFGLSGASDFIEDMKIRLETEIKIKEKEGIS